MKNTEKKVTICSGLLRNVAIIAKKVKRSLKGLGIEIYIWLTAGSINYIIKTQLNSLEKSIAGLQNEIYYNYEFYVILFLTLFLITIHDRIINNNKKRGKSLGEKILLGLAFNSILFFI